MCNVHRIALIEMVQIEYGIGMRVEKERARDGESAKPTKPKTKQYKIYLVENLLVFAHRELKKVQFLLNYTQISTAAFQYKCMHTI